MIATLLTRLSLAFTTIPSLQDWLIVLGILLAYGAIALSIGWYFGFLRPVAPPQGAWGVLSGAMITFFSPVLLEELIFRAMLIPHPAEGFPLTKWATWAAISLLLFVVYHPLKAPGLFKAGRSPLNEPIFPLLSGLLGLACTTAYALTGSVWTAIGLHWVVMTIWLFGLGGIAKLSQTPS
jgi:predicted Abi (CAAX) family protease